MSVTEGMHLNIYRYSGDVKNQKTTTKPNKTEEKKSREKNRENAFF